MTDRLQLVALRDGVYVFVRRGTIVGAVGYSHGRGWDAWLDVSGDGGRVHVGRFDDVTEAFGAAKRMTGEGVSA